MTKFNILISGSSGFVGRNLVPYLCDHNFNVFTVSLRGDFFLDEKMSVDAIIHLAGKAHDTNKISNPNDYFLFNTELTKAIFEFFLKSSARDFIFFSSVKAVLDYSNSILDENTKPNPTTPYGKSKLMAEEYILSKPLPESKRVIILRPSMIHGPGNKGNLNLLYNFIKKGIPYPLSAFQNRRSFLSIRNLLFIVERILSNPVIPSGIYNVADDESMSTVEVVKIIGEGKAIQPRIWRLPPAFIIAIAKTGDKLHLPLNSDRLRKLTENYIVSNQKIKNILGIPRLPISSRDGLLEAIRSFN